VTKSAIRSRARVEGVVQGVGFRPFVHRLAGELALDGFVLNDERGVLVEVQGAPDRVEAFLARLRDDAPPLAVVERVLAEPVEPVAAPGFRIVESTRGGPPSALVSADVATCDACLAELFDPADRRFHAQPIACPDCGPSLRPSLEEAVAVLLGGGVVAIKGLGGFHLACVAADERAVAALRARKHREDKPFALMVRDAAAAAELVELGALEEELLRSRARPIVLAQRHPDARVAAAVAPRARELGLMLPYTPLHHLLLADAGVPLVMTSGNVSDEPIAFEDVDAVGRLSSIADLLLLHDRPIRTRTDDSVVRVIGGAQPMTLRRSRGYVPASLALPVPAPRPILACGAELKSTFCLASGARAWVSHHIGDLGNLETLAAYTDGVAHFERLFDVAPEVVAHDLHPEYLSTRYALERDAGAHVGVQHHHAHLAACLAEHGEPGPAIGAIYDGTGYGTDGTIWGGELLAGDLTAFERAGHLRPVRMPGGEQAIRQPWRMACAWLQEALGEEPEPLAGVEAGRWRAVASLARGELAAPVTTSMGRLFDAVAALCGIRLEVTYEGQAAIELEAAAEPGDHGRYDMPLLDARPAILALIADLRGGTTPGVVAARFHDTVAAATADSCEAAASERGLELAVLSGGVFANRRLLEATAARLRAAGLRVLVPERLPPGDGGIAFGQASVAAAQSAQSPTIGKWENRAR